jgi:hypothetical protein
MDGMCGPAAARERCLVPGAARRPLNKFEAAVALANDGRAKHKGATKQLEQLATELASVVRTMDARNRQRVQDNRQLLESWISASTVPARGRCRR